MPHSARSGRLRGGRDLLYAVDATSGDVSDSETGTWLLTEELCVEDAMTLQVCILISSIELSINRTSMR